MTMPGYIDITELDERALIRAAYAASVPLGLGFLHARDGELDEETVDAILNHARKFHEGAINMDYVHGRAVKLRVRQEHGRRYVLLNWYDHGPEAMAQMLRTLGLPDVEARIEKARAEEDEAAAKRKERTERAARLLVREIHSRGGVIRASEEPWRNWHEIPEDHPFREGIAYGAEVAERARWTYWDREERTLTLTEAGRAIAEGGGTP